MAERLLWRPVHLKSRLGRLRKEYGDLAPAETKVMEAVSQIPELIANFNRCGQYWVVDTEQLILSRNPFGTFGRLDDTTYVSVRHVIYKGEGEPKEADLAKLRDDLRGFLKVALGAASGPLLVELSFDCLKEKPKKIEKGGGVPKERTCGG